MTNTRKLKLDSGGLCPPPIRRDDASVELTVRSAGACVVRGLEIDGDEPQDWLVHDLRVGNCSLFKQASDIPGDLFHIEAIGAFVLFGSEYSRAYAGVDISVTISYIGIEPAGKRFAGSILVSDA